MKVFKWIVLSIIIILALAIAGIGIVVATLDPNDYKDEIAAQVKKQTGRDLALKGDISWSLFPWLGLNLGETSLSNAEGFGDEPFASLEEVNVHVALLPLLKKQVEAQKIVLQGLSLNLEKNSAGKDNWSDLAGEKEAADEGIKDEEEGDSPAFSLNIGGVEIQNASLVFDDRQAGSKVEVSPFNLTTGAIVLGEPIDLKMDVGLKQADTTMLINVMGTLIADIDAGDFRVNSLVLEPVLSGSAIPGGKFSSVIGMDVHANTETQELTVSNLTVDAAGILVQGGIEVTKFIDAPRVLSQLSSNTFSPRQLMKEMGMEAPATTDSSVLSKASFRVNITGDTKRLSVSPFSLILDESRLEGSVRITDLSSQALAFDLELDRIDLDRYLPPVTEGGGAEVPAAASSDAIVLPVDLLKSLNVQGEARVELLHMSKLVFTDASINVAAKNGLLEVKPLLAHAYQGKAKISAALDVRNTTPSYDAQVDLTGVRSGEILETLFDDRYVSGVANFSSTISTQGDSVSSLTSGLNGNFKAKFSEGTIRGSQLGAKIIEASNFLRKLQNKEPLSNKASDETHFSVLSASGKINNGVVTNEDLQMIAPVMQIKGSGSVNLPAENLDYLVSIGLPPKEGKGRHFAPLKITGPFADPKFRLALDDVLKADIERKKAELEAELKAKADAEKAKLKKKAEAKKAELKAKAEAEEDKLKAEVDAKIEAKKEELKNQLEDKLKGLFK